MAVGLDEGWVEDILHILAWKLAHLQKKILKKDSLFDVILKMLLTIYINILIPEATDS